MERKSKRKFKLEESHLSKIYSSIEYCNLFSLFKVETTIIGGQELDTMNRIVKECKGWGPEDHLLDNLFVNLELNKSFSISFFVRNVKEKST